METSEPMNESYIFLRILFPVHSPNEDVFVFDMVRGIDDSNLHQMHFIQVFSFLSFTFLSFRFVRHFAAQPDPKHNNVLSRRSYEPSDQCSWLARSCSLFIYEVFFSLSVIHINAYCSPNHEYVETFSNCFKVKREPK